MSLLIDGYNLLHVTGIFGEGPAARSLESSRHALLGFLAKHAVADHTAVTIVFDAKDAPPGLPRCVDYRGITVHYAAGYSEADDLLEELIRQDTAPKRLQVVSSDHRVQRAARRRGAKAVDSDAWFAKLLRQRRSLRELEAGEAKREKPLTEDEVRWWLDAFGVGDEEQASEGRSGGQRLDHRRMDQRPAASEESNVANPFPPGYGEDLLDE
ncbi:MAG TPA: hypothetical protein DCY79_06510 [Planctomycetaceae bacterium]|nr:hypothetical protein [Blastopirellula sp.]HAY79444.1 hypothetical protein [Planctomycetaceae bacterium]|tara:strand:- start:65 stop:700 length:636 start_codon:yes stop_codon:yes gene_type:complete